MATAEKMLGNLEAEKGEAGMARELYEFSGMLENLKSNPVVADLCAIGFELLAGLVCRSEGYEGITLGQDVPYMNDRSRDVDVLGYKGDEIVIVECKAYHSGKELNPTEVGKFFTQTVPACRDWWRKKEGRPRATCRAELWTSGIVGESAQAALDELSLSRDVSASLCGPGEIVGRLSSPLKTRGMGLLSALAKGGRQT